MHVELLQLMKELVRQLHFKGSRNSERERLHSFFLITLELTCLLQFAHFLRCVNNYPIKRFDSGQA
jgi:hypothetical protein